MRYLKKYELFDNFLQKTKIKNICKKFGIYNYTINDDGSIDVAMN
jgi:hypothetical protein